MKKQIKVSVITPCLNSKRTIKDTIESVLNQTYKNIEYIVVDGESTDGTLDIIKEYLPQFHGRMKYISEKDNGIYDAMNKGIKMSTGAVIGIINSDDFYEFDAVENIVQYITGEKYQVIYGYCRIIDNNHITGIIKRNHKGLGKEMIPHPTCFITKKTYKDFGLFLTLYKITGDYELMLRLFYSGKVKFIQVKEILANFTLGGISSNKRCSIETTLIQYFYHYISFTTMIKKIARLYLK